MRLLNSNPAIPAYFWWKRLHSLAGFGLVLFIIFHLFTNSQTALWVGEYGRSYIHSVNAIVNTPYLVAVEFFILGLPIFIHAFLGIKYLFTSEMNTFTNDGKHPYLPEYGRNWAYSWMRITSWILLVGIIFHVVHMRFVEHPIAVQNGVDVHYIVRLNEDEGLPSILKKLQAQVVTGGSGEYQSLGDGQVHVLTQDYGTAELLIVRDAFKSPWLMLIYTVLVLTACFHAFNGLWTFMISWGITVTERSQRWMLHVTTWLMAFVVFLGLASIYGTYWINLRS